jgi:GNAT superfamily N-acetyltransferase
VDGKPAGWCAVAPRDDYPRIVRSPTTKPVDDHPAWAITCFFIAKEARGLGLMRRLIDAASAFAARYGATLVEAYPVDPGERRITPDAAYHGLSPAFASAGFEEVARRRAARPIMRRAVTPNRRRSSARR